MLLYRYMHKMWTGCIIPSTYQALHISAKAQSHTHVLRINDIMMHTENRYPFCSACFSSIQIISIWLTMWFDLAQFKEKNIAFGHPYFFITCCKCNHANFSLVLCSSALTWKLDFKGFSLHRCSRLQLATNYVQYLVVQNRLSGQTGNT